MHHTHGGHAQHNLPLPLGERWHQSRRPELPAGLWAGGIGTPARTKTTVLQTFLCKQANSVVFVGPGPGYHRRKPGPGQTTEFSEFPM